MNNELKINMKLVSSDNINMKLEDKKVIEANMTGGVIETDPIFVDSPAYTITYNDINYWNNKSDFSGNYNDLINKPIIPSLVSQLTNDIGYITKSVSNLENYTLTNALSNVAISGDYDDLLDKPTIPTDTSDLTNNAGFVTSDTTDLVNYTLSSDLASVATSGSYNDLYNTPELANVAISGDYDDLLDKPTLAVVASTGDYTDLTNKPTIPTKTSELTNDSGYITNANIPTKTSDLTNDSGFITMSDIPTIPTKTSELTNDSGFITNANIPTKTSDLTNDSGYITNSVNDLTNYTLTSNLSSVATSASYADLSNTPTIPIVDSSVSTSSTNAIENGAITSYVNTKGIYESGSNSNGNYIKYDDGTMICYATKSATMGAWSASGSLYAATNTTNISFPQTFISKPVLNVQIDYTDSGFWQAWFGRSIYSASEITYLQIWRTGAGSTGTAFSFDYIAIGRWKA